MEHEDLKVSDVSACRSDAVLSVLQSLKGRKVVWNPGWARALQVIILGHSEPGAQGEGTKANGASVPEANRISDNAPSSWAC